jgi:hypothetical protein
MRSKPLIVPKQTLVPCLMTKAKELSQEKSRSWCWSQGRALCHVSGGTRWKQVGINRLRVTACVLFIVLSSGLRIVTSTRPGAKIYTTVAGCIEKIIRGYKSVEHQHALIVRRNEPRVRSRTAAHVLTVAILATDRIPSPQREIRREVMRKEVVLGA